MGMDLARCSPLNRTERRMLIGRGAKADWAQTDLDCFSGFSVTIQKNGGDDETRTRDLCRDRVAGRRNLLEINGTDSPFLIL